MKKIFTLFTVIGLLAFSFIATSEFLVKVPGGNVGVVINLLGSSKGVDVQTLSVGRYWLSWNEEMFLFPTFTQNETYSLTKEQDESISFQSSEGLTVSGDFGISYNIPGDKANLAYQKWRKGVEEISKIYLRNILRDELNNVGSQMQVKDINGALKPKFILDVTTAVRNRVAPFGINVESIYLVSNLRIPKQVEEAINSSIAATQKAVERENQLKTAQAQAEIVKAEAEGKANAIKVEAEAQADANLILSKSLTPELVKSQAIQKWDGKMPLVSGMGNAILDLKELLPQSNEGKEPVQ